MLRRKPAIFLVGKACFLEIEVTFDPPPGLVRNPAVAQQVVNELSLGRNQLPRQLGSGRGDVAGFRIK
jgi:hypothetical protein